MPPETTPKGKDLLKQKYLTAQIDAYLTSDMTKIGPGWLLSCMELSTRKIVYHKYLEGKGNPFTSADVMTMLREIIPLLGRVEIFHTDKGQQYLAEEVQAFFARYKIKHSLTGDRRYKFSNQAHESWHKTLKDRLKDRWHREADLPTKPTTLRGIARYRKELPGWIDEAILCYNDRDQTSLIAASPNLMENALLALRGTTEEEVRRYIPDEIEEDYLQGHYPSAGEESERVYRLKLGLLVGYLRYCQEWYNRENAKTQTQLQKLQTEVTTRADEMLSKLLEAKDDIIAAQSKKLDEYAEELEKMRDQLRYLTDRERQKEQAELAKEERRMRRSARERRELRDPLVYTELEEAMSLIAARRGSNVTEYNHSRDRVCFLWMYLTGARVGMLSDLRVNQLESLLQGSEIQYQVSKKRGENYVTRLPLSPTMRELINRYRDDIIRTIGSKKGSDYAITKEGSTAGLNTNYLTRHLNGILSGLSAKSNRLLRTHSFRIGFTNSLIEVGGLNIAQKIVGHDDIETTTAYDRLSLSRAATTEYLEKAEKARRRKVLRPYTTKWGTRKVKKATTPLGDELE